MKINVPLVIGLQILIFGGILIVKFPEYFFEGIIFVKPTILFFIPSVSGILLFMYGFLKPEIKEK